MPQTNSKRGHRPDTIILPVETLTREFDAKLHLALRAAARGWRVIIGGRTAIHDALPRLPRSIYLAKDVRSGSRRILRLFEQFGHVIVAIDEESLIRPSHEASLMMLDEKTFNRPRLLYAWGESNADFWRGFYGYRDTPILLTGNPRVDLLRPEFSGYFATDAAALHERFGNYVVVSTNFSMVNHYIPDHVRFRTTKESDITRREHLKSELVAHKQKVFEAFRTMIPALADAIAPVNLVVRPHPSENPASWSAVAAGRKNVHVANDGPMAPWLMAARALVQNGCTSAVEAAIIGTPTLAFRPHISENYEVDLSNRLSIDCRTEEELAAALQKILSGEAPVPSHNHASWLAVLAPHIASLEGPLSCERILNSLDTHANRLGVRQENRFRRWVEGLWGHYRRRVIRAFTTRKRGSKSSAHYTLHKFPGLSEEMVANRIERFRDVLPELPAMSRRWLARDILILENSSNRDIPPGRKPR